MGFTGQYPPPSSPREARRQAKDYARRQRDQARTQRQYWRAYWRGGRRPSIIGPLVLLTIGVLALLVELGQLNGYTIWDWYVRWWPLMLIALGVILLAEYFFDRNDPYGRRRVGGGFVFLIILLLIAGWAAHGTRHWGRNVGIDDNDFWFLFGGEHDRDVQMSSAAPANAAVTVQDPRGDVTVTPSTDGQVHLQAHELVHTSSDSEAQKAFDAVHPQIAVSGGNVTVSVPEYRASRVDLTLAIPEGGALTVNAAHGDVSVEGLKNSADVTDPQGDVKLDGIAGDVHARMQDGDFSAHGIGGQLFLSGNVGDVTLSGVAGQVTMDGEFFGSTHMEDMGGAMHFHSSRTTLDITKLTGDLSLDSDDLSSNGMSGPVRIVTRSKNIELTAVSGDLHIENSDGDVNVTAAAPLGNVEIANRTGDLVLTVPENANFAVTGSTTEDDDLNTDFPLRVTTSSGRKQLSGAVGSGGARLDLSVTHGDLTLRKGSAELAAPAPPKPPRGPARHLRPPKTPVAPVQQ